MVYIAGIAGYDYISPRIVNLGIPGEGNYDLTTQPEMLAQTKKAMEYTGVGVHDVELMRILKDTDVKKYEPAIEVGAELGAKYVLSSIWTDDKNFYIEKFGELCDIVAKYNMGVQLEFVTWSDVFNLQMAKEVLEAVNRKNAGLMIDTLHAYRSRVKPEELKDCPQEWFRFVHLCDGPKEIPDSKDELIRVGRDAREYVGEGAIDIAAYMQYIPKTAACSIELPHLAKAAEFGYAEHARRCLATTKKYLAEHGL
jgi:sugar phosphate isomerase/epimerase